MIHIDTRHFTNLVQYQKEQKDNLKKNNQKLDENLSDNHLTIVYDSWCFTFQFLLFSFGNWKHTKNMYFSVMARW